MAGIEFPFNDLGSELMSKDIDQKGMRERTMLLTSEWWRKALTVWT